MKANRQFVEAWGRKNRAKQIMAHIRAATLTEEANHHLWAETPNLYEEKDLGYVTICGQRVKAKRVYESPKTSFIAVGEEFNVGKVG